VRYGPLKGRAKASAKIYRVRRLSNQRCPEIELSLIAGTIGILQDSAQNGPGKFSRMPALGEATSEVVFGFDMVNGKDFL
jgi:hypothetical protein